MKRSVVIAGHKTSISLEDAFWSSLRTQVLSAKGEFSAADRNRIQRVGELFGVDSKLAVPANFVIVAVNENPAQAKAS